MKKNFSCETVSSLQYNVLNQESSEREYSSKFDRLRSDTCSSMDRKKNLYTIKEVEINHGVTTQIAPCCDKAEVGLYRKLQTCLVNEGF